MDLIANGLRNIFCSWESMFKELVEYFQDKYNFVVDDEDIDAAKETFMEIANDIPKVVSISLYGQDITKDKKIIAEGSIQQLYKLRIFVNDEKAAHKIIQKLYYMASGNPFPINTIDIEAIVADVTNNKNFKLNCDYMEFDSNAVCNVCLGDTVDGYEIKFPAQPIKRGD